MLPLYLSIEGLYSYQQKQEIDFTALSEAGLFGIFGTVGSGKSSILEAIGYALYGETERLNKKEKRTYNMLNLKSNQALIDFEFLNFEGRKFRFVAQWKRKKKFQEITDDGRKAYEWIDNNWIPLESVDGAKVTNLSYPNFRRTIIIPQGQFKEFLELKGNDRSEMMKEIFFLNQYDLGPKVSHMIANNTKKIEHLKGALSGYEDVNSEIIEQKNAQFQTLTSSLDNLKKEYSQLETQIKSLENSRQNRLDLANRKAEFQELELKKIQIQKVEKEINEFELVTTTFREYLNNLSEINISKSDLLTKIELLKENKDSIKNTLIEVEKALQDLQPQYENLDNSKFEIQDLKRLIQNLEATETKTEKEAGIAKGKEFLAIQNASEQQLTTLITQLEQQIEFIKSTKINSADLLAIDKWYHTNEQFGKDLAEKNKSITDIKSQIEDVKSKFLELGFDETDWTEKLTLKIQNIGKLEEAFKKQESELRLKQELAHYAHNLHDGEPCPLCGAAEHPSPMQIGKLEEEFASLEIKKNSIQADKNILEKEKSDLQFMSLKFSEKQLELEKFSHDAALINTQYQAHQNSYSWTDFDKDDRAAFENKKNEIFKIEEQLNQYESELKGKREQLQKTRETIQKSERKLNDYQNEINILAAKIQQNLQQIQVVDIEKYAFYDKKSVEEKSIQIDLNIKRIESEYQNYSKKLLEYRTQYAEIKGKYVEAQGQYAIYTAKLQETQSVVNKLLLEHNYADIATIKLILSKNLNINALRQQTQEFHVSYKTLQNRLAELEELTENDDFTEEKYAALTKLILSKKEYLEQQIELYGALKDDLDRLNTELKEKQDLLIEYQKLDIRRENLKILDNMFRGNGFVNYVSSIHLQRLCEIANQRFHRLTKNQLSLVINENNEFEVIDYLNNGYRRSAKTLSGGQAFQASLCLALALAENIQSLNKADKNFFFIDEGFGTQDAESINTVFDTLQYLHQENRVVGIISHVEELKERMPRAITIVKDLEKGSQIIPT